MPFPLSVTSSVRSAAGANDLFQLEEDRSLLSVGQVHIDFVAALFLGAPAVGPVAVLAIHEAGFLDARDAISSAPCGQAIVREVALMK